MAPKRKTRTEPNEEEEDIDEEKPEAGSSSSSAAAKEATPKKKRAPPLRSLPGVSKDLFNATKPAPIKKMLKAFVREVAQMVDLDWHDGYEEQEMKVVEYLKAWEEPLDNIMKIAEVASEPQAFQRCNDVMLTVADSWVDMQAIPARLSIEECAENAELDFFTNRNASSADDFIASVWKSLIRSAANQATVDDALLYRMIKDANDYDCDLTESKEENAFDEVERERLKNGCVRLAKLLAEKQNWTNLPSNYKTHRMRSVMDRRYDGPKHLRTRHFSDEEEEGDFW